MALGAGSGPSRTGGRAVGAFVVAAVVAAVVVAVVVAALWAGSGSPRAEPVAGDDVRGSASLDAAPPASATPAPSPAPSPAFDRLALSTTDPDSPWVVVNKQHPLRPVDHAPAALTAVGGVQVSARVADDLRALLAAAEADGVQLTLISGYRSYGYQAEVHQRAIAAQGVAAAERVSARAGHSEHQTGLAVDLGGRTDPACDLQECFAGTPEGRWLAAHAGAHGFLLRYPAADTAVTGYSPEPWHFRWVGTELVTAMAAQGVRTLEEFFGVSGGSSYVTP